MNRLRHMLRRLWGRRLPGEPEPMNRYVILSAAAHVLAVLVLSIPLSQRPRPIFAEPVYDVALVDWPEPNYKPPVPTRKVERPKPKPVEEPPKPEPEPEPEVIKVPEKETPKPKKEEPPEVKKPKVEPAEKEPEEKPAEPETPQPKVDIPDVPPEPVSLGMVDQRDFKHDWYLQQVKSLLAAKWSRPRSGAGLMQATVHFIIQKDGTVVQPYIVEPSGSSLYDRAALRAVVEARKFAPLPVEYSGNELGISVKFQTMGDAP